ncbi:MAG TPA: selenide, water dikinase SelD [Leptospiraceae bacterium]|nr:selenide, water dikinase SelD [Leptospiraceae bacterium]
MKQIVFAGGGHSHCMALMNLAAKKKLGKEIILVSDHYEAVYSGMLPGYIGMDYSRDEILIDLWKFTRKLGIGFIHSKIQGIRASEQKLILEGRSPLFFDLLSVNAGVICREEFPGSHLLTPLKPAFEFLNIFRKIWGRWLEKNSRIRIGILGGGIAGLEVQYSLRERFARSGMEAEIQIFEKSDTLPKFNPGMIKFLKKNILSGKINYNLSKIPVSCEIAEGLKKIRFSDETEYEFDDIFLCTSGRPPELAGASDLSRNESGFFQVNSFLQTLSHSNVFASGDCASMQGLSVPKAGVYAVRQGKPLSENIIRFTEGKPLKEYIPQKSALALVYSGNSRAFAVKGNFFVPPSSLLFSWKDGIDRKFMNRFSEMEKMPAMKAADESMNEMHCAGCGSKISGKSLKNVIERIKKETEKKSEDSDFIGEIAKNISDFFSETKSRRSELILDMHSSEDVSSVLPPKKMRLLQSTDHFSPMISDHHTYSRILTLHALSDLYAKGAVPDSVLISLTLPYMPDGAAEETAYQLLSGAVGLLSSLGIHVLGGHTSEGPELQMGMTCNGFVYPGRERLKKNLKSGDALILTKPLGTGLIFAADQRCLAEGRWVEAAVESMLLSNEKASEIFEKYNVRACTDVTGFGLAGHLSEMLNVSGLGADIYLSQLKLIEGTEEILKTHPEIQSSMYPANWSAFHHFFEMNLSQDYINRILYDPQTSGGLLAGISKSKAEACTEELHRAGYRFASCIGITNENRGIMRCAERS